MSKPPSAAAARSAADARNRNKEGNQSQLPSSPSPSLTTAGGDNGNAIPPMTPEKELYPRRFPRIGSQFQTRISKSTEPSDRPSPMLLSTDFPYLTSDDVRKERQKLSEEEERPPPVVVDEVESHLTTTEDATSNGHGRWAKTSGSNSSDSLPHGRYQPIKPRRKKNQTYRPQVFSVFVSLILPSSLHYLLYFCLPTLLTQPSLVYRNTDRRRRR